MHVIVPEPGLLVDEYVKSRGECRDAADRRVRETFLSRESRASLSFRRMEFLGGFGLSHRWMYDRESIARRVEEAGFRILEANERPGAEYRRDDGISVHVVGAKPAS